MNDPELKRVERVIDRLSELLDARRRRHESVPGPITRDVIGLTLANVYHGNPFPDDYEEMERKARQESPDFWDLLDRIYQGESYDHTQSF